MADSDPLAAGAAPAVDPNAPEFSLQSVYLKDCSYEAPKGPRIEGQWNPQISLDLNTAASSSSSADVASSTCPRWTRTSAWFVRS